MGRVQRASGVVPPAGTEVVRSLVATLAPDSLVVDVGCGATLSGYSSHGR